MAVKHVSFAGKLPAGMAPSRPAAKKTATRVGVGTARPMKAAPGRSGASRTPMASGSARALSTNQLQNGLKGALAGGRRGMSGGYTMGGAMDQRHSLSSGKINTAVKTSYSPSNIAGKKYKTTTSANGTTRKTMVSADARAAQLKKMNNQLASARRASANDAKLYQYQLAKSGKTKAKKLATKLKRGI